MQNINEFLHIFTDSNMIKFINYIGNEKEKQIKRENKKMERFDWKIVVKEWIKRYVS